MAYAIIGENGKVKVHKGKEVQGSDVIVELAQKTIIDPDKRIVEVVSSSDRQDRDGDRISQEGIDHQFANSVLYAHDYGRTYLPIGKQLGNRVEKREDFFVTVEEHQFNPPGAYELSDAAWKLVDFGALATTSIGFIPKIVVRAESDDERANMGLGRWGVFFESIEKLETSWVPVPSNRDAVREAFGKSIINRTERNLLFPKDWDKITKPEHWAMGIEFEEKKPDEAEDVVEDIEGITLDPGTPKPGAKTLEIEKRLDVLEKQAEDLGLDEIRDEIEGLKQEIIELKNNLKPEPDALEETQDKSEKETLSLDKDQVGEIKAAIREVFNNTLVKTVDKKLKAILGIVD